MFVVLLFVFGSYKKVVNVCVNEIQAACYFVDESLACCAAFRRPNIVFTTSNRPNGVMIAVFSMSSGAIDI
jgi:hypothetical protein